MLPHLPSTGYHTMAVESVPTAVPSRPDNALSPTVQDQVSTGTDKILSSPHVSEGPGRIANAPVPSVFRDDRGEIHRLRISSTAKDHSSAPGRSIRVNLLYSRADIMRSGYLHPLPKRDVVLSGRVEVWTLTADATVKRTYEAGESFEIEAYVPHILFSLDDSVVAEWWEEAHSGKITSLPTGLYCFHLTNCTAARPLRRSEVLVLPPVSEDCRRSERPHRSLFGSLSAPGTARRVREFGSCCRRRRHRQSPRMVDAGLLVRVCDGRSCGFHDHCGKEPTAQLRRGSVTLVRNVGSTFSLPLTLASFVAHKRILPVFPRTFPCISF